MSSRAWIGGWMIALGCLAACGDSSPTGPSPIPSGTSPGATSAGTPSTGAMSSRTASGAMGASDTEEFNCLDVETTRVRFGPPGYVEDDRVGLYVYFGGMSTGAKRLRIWWDIENDPVTYHDFVFDESETEIEEVYEHQYPGLTGPVEMLVRVELIRDGLTGNCARNRRVLVAPSTVPGSSGSSVPSAVKKTASVGPAVSSVNFSGFGSEGIRFTVSTALTLDSVSLSPSGSGNVVIDLTDSTGVTTFASKTVPVTGGIAQAVSLGFSIPPGDYILTLDASGISPASAGATFSFGGSGFPYDIPGVISLTETAFNAGSWGFYYYFYDWQVTW
jgi:hypothetical protein